MMIRHFSEMFVYKKRWGKLGNLKDSELLNVNIPRSDILWVHSFLLLFFCLKSRDSNNVCGEQLCEMIFFHHTNRQRVSVPSLWPSRFPAEGWKSTKKVQEGTTIWNTFLETNVFRTWKWWFPSSESPNLQGSIFRCYVSFREGITMEFLNGGLSVFFQLLRCWEEFFMT